MLELCQVSKRYAERTILGPLDLRIEPRCTTVLIGPSGSGKSTVLRLMVGLIRPTSGSVIFDGTEHCSDSIVEQRRRMGYVIQDGGLFPHLSAERNVCLAAEYLGWDAARIARRLDELCTLTRFPSDTIHRYPSELSGGQRQRVSLMRALMLDPAVLLLDEPLGALDPMIRADLQTDLRDIFRELGKTVVMVTHDLREAAFFADSVVLFSEGRIVQRGTVEQLMKHPSDGFVTRFINAQEPSTLTVSDGK